ncbi:hypothetical protein C8R47DRAFT_939685, partial [Mycena vitilis]
SEWLKQAQCPYSPPHHAADRTLCFMVLRLLDHLCVPIKMVFVFNGHGSVSQNQVEVVESFQMFLWALGVVFHTAPGEAESELAKMSAHNLIDAVSTNSPHVLALGATRVIRSLKHEGGSFMLYTAEAIQECALSRGGLILAALLTGDAHSSGVLGCGKAIAVSLARQGLGDDLLEAARTLHGDALHAYISEWKANLVEELQQDPSGRRGRRYFNLAQRIGEDSRFPDLDILKYYLSPVTSWSNGGGGLRPFPFHPWDLSRLAGLCEKYLS